MNTLNALLRAIITNPDEDTVRLAYADRLMERNRLGESGSRLTDDRVLFDRIRQSIDERWEPQRIDYTSQWWPLPKDFVGYYRRRFYEIIECTAEDFLAHADELIWHPEQVDWCMECGRTGSRLPGKTCEECCGQGEVPRPCPDTAQPIRKVVLTTIPGLCDGMYRLAKKHRYDWLPTEATAGSNVTQRRFAIEILSKEWPGIEFVLPPADTMTIPVPESGFLHTSVYE